MDIRMTPRIYENLDAVLGIESAAQVDAAMANVWLICGDISRKGIAWCMTQNIEHFQDEIGALSLQQKAVY